MKLKMYYHKTDGGAEYLFDTFVKWEHNGKSGKEGVINEKTKYMIRLDGKQPELTIKDDPAPELLAALAGLLSVLEAEPEACGIYKAHAQAARDAIRKAEAK